MSIEFEHNRRGEDQALPFSSVHQAEGVSRRLAPEDVRVGQYVCVLVRHQGYWRFDREAERLVRERVCDLPEQDDDGDQHSGGRAGAPLKVLAVSLPFVVVRAVGVARPVRREDGGVDGDTRPVRTLDLRQAELAEVGRAYARAYAGACRPVEGARAMPAPDGDAPPGVNTS